MEKTVADAGVISHAFGYVLDVCPDNFTEIGNFINIGNFQRKKIVGSIFNHLSAPAVCDNKGLVEIFINVPYDFFCSVGLRADNDTGSVKRIRHGSSLREKFRVGDNLYPDVMSQVVFD